MRFFPAPMGALLALTTLTLSLAAAPPPGATAIRQTLAREAAAWNRGDIRGFMSAYWDSDQTQFIGAGGITLGWKAVLDHYLKAYPNPAAMGRLTFSGVQVTVLDPGAAYVVGHYRLDRAHDHPEGVFTLLFRRFPQGWRIVSDHTTAAAAAH